MFAKSVAIADIDGTWETVVRTPGAFGYCGPAARACGGIAPLAFVGAVYSPRGNGSVIDPAGAGFSVCAFAERIAYVKRPTVFIILALCSTGSFCPLFWIFGGIAPQAFVVGLDGSVGHQDTIDEAFASGSVLACAFAVTLVENVELIAWGT